MIDLNWKEIEILRAVSRGHDTAQAILPKLSDTGAKELSRHPVEREP